MKEAYEGIFVHDAQIFLRKLDELEYGEVNEVVLCFEDGVGMGIIDM